MTWNNQYESKYVSVSQMSIWINFLVIAQRFFVSLTLLSRVFLSFYMLTPESTNFTFGSLVVISS